MRHDGGIKGKPCKLLTGRSQAREVECIDPLIELVSMTKESVSQEPCASKEASTVLKPSGGSDPFA